MLTSQVFKSRSGLHYSLRHTTKCFGSLPNRIKAEPFTDKNAALQFVRNMQVPLFFWQNVAQENSFFSYTNWKNSNPWASIESYIAQALVQGSVVAYETASISELNETRQLRSFKDTNGKSFELQPAAALLVDATAEVKPVSDKTSAEKILQDLGITAHSAKSINKSLNLSTSNINSIEVLKAALIKGEIVVTQQAEALKPSTGQDFIETVFEAPKSAVAPPPQTESSPVETSPTASPTRAENATADGLTKAAAEGTPFCEECAQAKNAA
jgi:hypothetical protein